MNSILEYINKRASSTFLVSISVFYAILNTKAIYVTLFVDQQLIFNRCGLFKNEYIEKIIFPNYFINVGYFAPIITLIIAIALSCVYVWWLPKIINLAYKKEMDYKYERKKIKLRKEQELIDEREKLSNKKLDIAKIDSETTEIENKSNNRKIEEWNHDYDNMSKSTDFPRLMDDLINYAYNNNYLLVNISTKDKARLDVWGLMNESRITEKGRFFLRKYMEPKG